MCSSDLNSMIEQLQTELPGICLILTGGDANVLQSQLVHESNVESNLVLKGMAIIYRAHVAN